ncbi:conserved glutamic acid-rich protein [Paecilomyces variotii No. 5]|uniref:Conserved glutamic acid-rich protein n=1 Tax=Byssochlamys spectabilis (strain No. 5 / NBRC 109023) TaxID=1356009 RepID=V5FVI4_BYSSN|nr:conserved glutamic acid-rich protein [Paecilomyces variotii No. 5]
MAGSNRQSLRKRKRNSTARTVDLLNGLAKDNTPPPSSPHNSTLEAPQPTDATQARPDRHDAKAAEPQPPSNNESAEDGVAESSNGSDESDSDDLPSISRLFELKDGESEGNPAASDRESRTSNTDSPGYVELLPPSYFSSAEEQEDQQKKLRLQPLVEVAVPMLSSPFSSSPSAGSQSSEQLEAEPNGAEQSREDPDVEMDEETSESPNDDSGEESTAEETPDPLFLEASQILNLEDSWTVLVQQAPLLGNFAEERYAHRFENINGLLEELIQLYSDPANQYINGHRVPSDAARNLIQAIFDEAMGFLNKACREAKKLHIQGSTNNTADLVDAFEAHVIPALTLATCLSLRAHYVDGKLRGFRDLTHGLKVLHRLCERISNLRTEGCLDCSARSRILRTPAKRILTALERDMIWKWPPPPKRRRPNTPEVIELDSDGAISPIRGSRGRWSRQEGETLLDGLKLYQGPDRYRQIIKHYGQRLKGRTVADLQAKAREIRDNYRPVIQEQLRTYRGREQWAWLLSV